THFYVNESGLKTDPADVVFVHVSGHPGGLLGPRDPKHAGRSEAAGKTWKELLQLRLGLDEEHCEIEPSLAVFDKRAGRNRDGELLLDLHGQIDERNSKLFFDAELLRKWGSRIASHGGLPG